MLRVALLALMLVSCGGSEPAGLPDPGGDDPTPVSTTLPPRTEITTFHSEVVADSFRLVVRLPFDYDRGEGVYPVVYMLDGNAYIGDTLNIDRTQRLQSVPEFVLVAIGYPGPTRRDRDYTPTASTAWPGSGGGEAFMQFIRTELQPWVEATYRIDPNDRTLFGQSFGGLAAMYALFRHNDFFERIVAVSPSMWFDDQVLFEFEQEWHAENDDLSAVLFTAMGDGEVNDTREGVQNAMIRPWNAMVDSLTSRGYPSLTMKQDVIPNTTHVTVANPAFIEAIKWIFR